MKKYILISSLALAFTTNVEAQQLYMFTQYMQNDFVLNPAITGSETEFCPIRMVVRKQWNGIENGPSTQTLSGHCSMYDGKMGIGGYLFNDKFGIVSRTGLNASYAYRVNMGKDSKFSMGISAMFYRYHLSADSLMWDADGNTDPVIYAGSGNFKTYVPNANFGLHYAHPKFWIGVGIPDLIPMKVTATDSFYVVREVAHKYINAGYKLKLGDATFLKPSIMVKQVKGAPVQLDFNTMLEVNPNFNIGASFRTGDAISLMFNARVKEKFVIGYAYDYIISDLNRFTKGNHEIVLGYNISCKKKEETTGDGPMEEKPKEEQPKENAPEPPKEDPK